MIIPAEIIGEYNQILPFLEKLKENIDPILKEIADNLSGLYLSRIKTLESFTQKLESGKFDPDRIVDLFGATIVMPTSKEIELVEQEVSSKFTIHKKIENREKAPEEFTYDDLHLYISFKPLIEVPGTEYLKRKFELQIKTFLQYSWDKATHDLLYKGRDMSWPLFRVAYQTKAMLEQADQILVQIEKTSNLCPTNPYKILVSKNLIASIVERTWRPEQLPSDIRRLAKNIYDLLTLCEKETSYLERQISKPKNNDLVSAKSVTPYEAVVGILIQSDPDSLKKGLKKAKRKILVTKELRDVLGNVPKDILDLSLELKNTLEV